MRIELNTDTKTIIVKGQTTVQELLEALNKLGLDYNNWSIISDNAPYYFTGGFTTTNVIPLTGTTYTTGITLL